MMPVEKHDERCPECKAVIRGLLEEIYGKVEENARMDVSALGEEFNATPYNGPLQEIFEALKNFRGHSDLVRSKRLPRCDFFVPEPGIILEFDESQHFTVARKIALENYPAELQLGFNKSEWVMLCERLNKKDNDPPFRDEQRSWYDTLRDFLPVIKDWQPTVRIYSKEFVWCNLDSNNPNHVNRFKGLIAKKVRN